MSGIPWCAGWPPQAVEGFGGQAELDDKVAREVHRLDLAALFAPEAEQGALVIAHDDPGIRATDEMAATDRLRPHVYFHRLFLWVRLVR
jgi:hypothetical protein